MKKYIVYKLQRKENGKTDKIPHSPITGGLCGIHKKAHQVTYQEALNAVNRFGLDGVGRVFSCENKEFFLDIDHGVDKKGRWKPEALAQMRVCRGMESELSQSRTGLHFFGPYEGEAPEHSCRGENLELYHTGRYAALTGVGIRQTKPTYQTHTFQALVKEYFESTAASGPGGLSGQGNDLSPEEIITRACKDKGNPWTPSGGFKRLWEGDEGIINEKYGGDRSSADAALTQHLAFWTGKDPDKMREMLLMSGLKREKWEKHSTYLDITINNALSIQEECYTTATATATATATPSTTENDLENWPGAEFIETYPLCTPAQQMKLFEGCVYVTQRHQVYCIQNGKFLSPDQFKSYYGGREYSLDNRGHKFATNAWEAFINSRAVRFPRVQDTCFKPDKPCGQIFKEENIEYINIYKDLDIPCVKGEVSKFIRHLGLLLPNERDRKILLSFMAACVQYKGTKFQWAPVVQGVQGNGKTFISRALEYCVGKRYIHRPSPEDLGDSFNGWLENKLLITVEEMKVKHNLNLMETLKTMITGFDGYTIKNKFQNAKQADLTCNFFFTSNHKNAVVKTKNERRFAIFFTAQQEVEDLSRSGMQGEYFRELYDWAKNGGYSHIHHYLKNYSIPKEFDPTKGDQRAPRTSSLEEAVSVSESLTQKLIREAIESEMLGFRNGYISSIAVKSMLREEGKKVSAHAMKEILKNLGYRCHGRTTRASCISVDRGQRPIIYANTECIDEGYTDNYENHQKGLDTSLGM